MWCTWNANKKRQNAKTKSVNLLYNFSQKQENRTNLAMILESLLVTRDRPEAVQTSWASATNARISLLTFFLIGHTAKSRLFYNNLHTHPFNGPFQGIPRWSGTRKVKLIWILLKQETVSGSGISRAICKSAPCSRQITMPAPHRSIIIYNNNNNDRLTAFDPGQPG